MQLPAIATVIQRLNLVPLWTTDYLTEFYVSSQSWKSPLSKDFSVRQRPAFNCAYYLLPAGAICPFQRMFGEDVMIHCMGAPVQLHIIDQSGAYRSLTLGKDVDGGNLPGYVLGPEEFVGLHTVGDYPYALLSETCVPGFLIGDHERGYWEVLLQKFPNLPIDLKKYAWPPGMEFLNPNRPENDRSGNSGSGMGVTKT